MQRPLRVLLVGSHPVQYATPIFQVLAKDPRVEIQVAYCGMQGAEAEIDPGFGVPVKWDIPLLDGYPWVRLPNHSRSPGSGSFFGLFNPGIWRLISRGKFDAVVLYTGYTCATFWMALAAAKRKRARVLFGTDAHQLRPLDNKRWKIWVKRWLWPRLFGLADVVLAPSSGTVGLMRSLGIPEERIALAPYCVDNDWWVEQSGQVDRRAVRTRWNVPEDAMVVLFCGKLQPWKRPRDLLLAFAQVSNRNVYLVFAGEGPLRKELESEVRSLGIGDQVRFLGFVNQSGLPETYTASDVFVLPSESEAFGVVVNEAMLCRCPVIVSDRVGARLDLVREGQTGYIFSCGDIKGLAAILTEALRDRSHLQRMGELSRNRMSSWSVKDYVSGLMKAVFKALERQSQGSIGEGKN